MVSKRTRLLVFSIACVLSIVLVGCSGESNQSAKPDFENDVCIVQDLMLDNSEYLNKVTAQVTNQTDSDETFTILVDLYDSSDAKIGEALLITDVIEPGKNGTTTTGTVTIGNDMIFDENDPAVDKVERMEVHSVATKSQLSDYSNSDSSASANSSSGDSSGTSSSTGSHSDIVGKWYLISMNINGEGGTLDSKNENATLQVDSDGTLKLTVSGSTVTGRWVESDVIEGVPYAVEMYDEYWGVSLVDDTGMGFAQVDDTDNRMLFMR